MLKSAKDRGNIPEEMKWHRAIGVQWVLMYMGVYPSRRPRKFTCIKDKKSTLPKYSEENSW